MKLIINTTNLKQGGALQVAFSFINEIKKFDYNNQYHIFLCPALQKQINTNDFPDNFKFYNFNNPNPLIIFDKTIKKLQQTETKINPDIVFSIFGPTYWTPKTKHIMGFAIGNYIYDDVPHKKLLSNKEKFILFLKKQYHRFLLKKNAEFYITETKDVKNRLSKYINTDLNNIFVVSNTYNSVYNNPVKLSNAKLKENNNEFRLILISSYYYHKNIKIIKDVIPEIKKTAPNLKFKFILTLPDNIFNKIFDNKDNITNIGPVKVEECPYYYSISNALFLPTLVESFTASYLEAMKMKLPIITSDLPFAHEICGNSAIYFNPFSPVDIAKKIITLANNFELQNKLIKNGEKRLKNFPTAEQKAEQYLKIFKQILDYNFNK